MNKMPCNPTLEYYPAPRRTSWNYMRRRGDLANTMPRKKNPKICTRWYCSYRVLKQAPNPINCVWTLHI